MNEYDILNGFITAPSSRALIKKPWLTFLGKSVVATNGRTLISVPKDLLEDEYRPWDNIFYREPYVEMFIGSEDDSKYCKLEDNEFKKAIECTKANWDSNGNPIITPVKLRPYMDNSVVLSFDFFQLVPIYNALQYFEEEPYVRFRGYKKPLLFKTVKQIEMAIMPLK